MSFRVKNLIKKSFFNMRCKKILSTPSIKIVGNDPIVISAVNHLDLEMYLVAIKSFYKQLGQGRVCILDDGTLSLKDKDLLKYHIRGVEIYDAGEIGPNKYCRDISWKRLALVCDLNKEGFVIQLDSDTIIRKNINEIEDCVKKNTAFILGTKGSQKIEPMTMICERVEKWPDYDNVQVIGERNFKKINGYKSKNYIRGGGAFFGLPKKSILWHEVEGFYDEMQRIIGDKWYRWGSEQLTVNYFVANLPQALVLPYPKYASFFLEHLENLADSSFLHFVGTDRFKKGYYIKYTREFIRNLRVGVVIG